MYVIGYHSSDDRYCHVSWNGTDLFDVALYGNPGEPQDEADKAQSLDALSLLVNRANKQVHRDHLVDDRADWQHVNRLVESARDYLLNDRSPSNVDLLTLSGIEQEIATGTPFLEPDEAVTAITDILRHYI